MLKFKKWMEHNENAHIGDTSDDISSKLHASNKKIVEPQTEHALKTYSLHSYELNKNLIKNHNQKKKLDSQSFHVKKKLQMLDEATHQPIGHHVHLYSGLGFDPRHLKKKRGHMFLPAFTSMTHDKAVAHQFSEIHIGENSNTHSHILHLHMKPEDHAAHLSSVSEEPEEHETLLPRRTLVKIHHTPTILKEREGHTVHVWHGEVVRQPENNNG